jgi:hypothetical protein
LSKKNLHQGFGPEQGAETGQGGSTDLKKGQFLPLGNPEQEPLKQSFYEKEGKHSRYNKK